MSENNIEEEEKYSPYCPMCSACGEEGCCSALMCRHDPKGHYCAGYIEDLRFGYAMYDDIMDLLHKDEEKNKELLEIIEGLFDKNYDIFYRDRIEQNNQFNKQLNKEKNGENN